MKSRRLNRGRWHLAFPNAVAPLFMRLGLWQLFTLEAHQQMTTDTINENKGADAMVIA
jgi:hypothetical protein